MSAGNTLRKRRYAKLSDITNMGAILGSPDKEYSQDDVDDQCSNAGSTHYYGSDPSQQDDCMIHYPGEGWFANMSMTEKVLLGAVILAVVVMGFRMFTGSGDGNGVSSMAPFSSGGYFSS
ncbi:hypothetical protein [Mandarin fish ranavirus]|nr:hypothetical protein [Mandarin fish ranavirus]WHA35497.1 hypothetical protein MSRaV_9R [Micropterus salmoides ranavirus]WHA35602.1 hypothetical protein SCRaV_9R [Siniperca chuatsi ranavirus]